MKLSYILIHVKAFSLPSSENNYNKCRMKIKNVRNSSSHKYCPKHDSLDFNLQSTVLLVTGRHIEASGLERTPTDLSYSKSLTMLC